MMKILIVGLTNQMGGTENYIYNLMGKLDLSKYYCDFLIVDDGGKTPYEKEINQLYNDNKNHFYYCPNLKNNYIVGSRWLKKFYDKGKYDLIYLNATTAAKAAYCRYAVSKLKTPLITHSHRSEGRRLNHTLYKSYTYKHSTVKLACSSNAADWMFRKLDHNVDIISNGIDTDRFKYNEKDRCSIRLELGFQDDDIIIGHVGRFSEEKNHKLLVNLCKDLDEKFKFLFIGEGPLKKELLESIEQKNLKKRICVLPVRKDVNRFYSAMDVFAMPSFNEGLPIVSVEAQCSGLRCIFSDTVSKETNLSGKCSYLPLDNRDAWIAELRKVDFERYDGVKVIRDVGFDMRTTASKIEVLFDKCRKASTSTFLSDGI